MDGIVAINKASGMTSHDVVARMRRLTRQKRVGHAGTLDPAATGVLPVCLGQATRVAEYLSESGKAYRATVRFGVVTDTYDAEGSVVRTADVALELDTIEAALQTFIGAHLQVPPVYSAIKRGGQPLYKLARAGVEVTPEARMVVIESLQVVSWQSPDLVLDVECGKGTYIRSLAYDLGERLGPGAHLAALTRTRSGPFRLAQAVTLEQFEESLASEGWRAHVFAADEALLEWRAAILGTVSERRMQTGLPLRFAGAAPVSAVSAEATETSGASAALLRAYATDGRFLGIARWDVEAQAWQPHKVMIAENEAVEGEV